MTKKPINVTKSYLPDLDDFVSYLKGIWDRNQLTNNGPLVNKLESALKEFLNIKHLFLVSNGTIALQIAIKALELKGEIITTPYSYVATTSTIVWEGCQPVFVDIDPKTLCIDPNRIEAAITPQTTAIMPTHVYGIPCAVEAIEEIANKHHLKIIYDAAHTFGVQYRNAALSSYGDISVLSFHATKIFHTIEGGAIITPDDSIAHRIGYMRNFGHKGQEDFWGLGINAKNSELHAAMGLSILPHIKEIIHTRECLVNAYNKLLKNLPLQTPHIPTETHYNFAYYPILFNNEHVLLRVKNALNQNNIYPRRYFYPSLSKLPYIKDQPMQISEDISKRVLCLPLFDSLSLTSQKKIARIIQENL